MVTDTRPADPLTDYVDDVRHKLAERGASSLTVEDMGWLQYEAHQRQIRLLEKIEAQTAKPRPLIDLSPRQWSLVLTIGVTLLSVVSPAVGAAVLAALQGPIA